VAGQHGQHGHLDVGQVDVGPHGHLDVGQHGHLDVGQVDVGQVARWMSASTASTASTLTILPRIVGNSHL